MQIKTFVASAIISELQSSDIYLTVKARLFDLNANLNGVRVTAAFLDEIVKNEEKYVGIPLCADVRGLIANETIGHMYDKRTGQFHSTAIGSFYHFEKEEQDGNTFLVGYARIMKRNKAVCNAIWQLFASNSLKFSFEISCSQYTEDESGILVIDASEHNFLQGAAVVTFPACEQAVALQLVAECLKGDENMHDDINIEEIAAQVETNTEEIVAENETASEQITENASLQIDASKSKDCGETSQPEGDEEKTEQQQNATCKKEEDASCKKQNASCGKKKQAECDAPEDPEEKDDTEQNASCKKEDASCGKEEDASCKKQQAQLANYDTLIAELNSKLAQLLEEVNSIKSQLVTPVQVSAEEAVQSEVQTTQVVAQAHTAEKSMRDEIIYNPFMAEMSTPSRYSLLDKRESISGYSLLQRR